MNGITGGDSPQTTTAGPVNCYELRNLQELIEAKVITAEGRVRDRPVVTVGLGKDVEKIIQEACDRGDSWIPSWDSQPPASRKPW